MNKLTKGDVEKIKELYNNIYTVKDLMIKYDVSKDTIINIGKTPINQLKKRYKLSLNEALVIHKLYNDKYTLSDIAKQYNVSRNTIYGHINGWKKKMKKKKKKKGNKKKKYPCHLCGYLKEYKYPSFCSIECYNFFMVDHRKKTSERMKKRNPMFNEENVDKAKNTFKRKIRNGELKYKKGPEHWLWKGNRTFNQSCRTRLYKTFIFKVLERDNFECQICYSKKNLQVHHLKQMKKIIEKILTQNNINDISTIDPNSKKYNFLITQVVNAHRISYGITLCHSCHKKYDYNYRRKNI